MERTFALAQFWYCKRFFLLQFFFLPLTSSNQPLNSSSQESTGPFPTWIPLKRSLKLLVEGGGSFPHYDISLVFSLLYLQRSLTCNVFALLKNSWPNFRIQVAVFCPSSSARYLNITLANLTKVRMLAYYFLMSHVLSWLLLDRNYYTINCYHWLQSFRNKSE